MPLTFLKKLKQLLPKPYLRDLDTPRIQTLIKRLTSIALRCDWGDPVVLVIPAPLLRTDVPVPVPVIRRTPGTRFRTLQYTIPTMVTGHHSSPGHNHHIHPSAAQTMHSMIHADVSTSLHDDTSLHANSLAYIIIQLLCIYVYSFVFMIDFFENFCVKGSAPSL